MSLSQIYSKLRGDSSGEKNEDAAQVGAVAGVGEGVDGDQSTRNARMDW